MIKLWTKFLKRKKEKIWKTDCYFGAVNNAVFRGHEHLCVSGAIIVNGKIDSGETYYLRDICGNVLINKDEDGNSLI